MASFARPGGSPAASPLAARIASSPGALSAKPVKKLVIRNLKKAPELDESFGETTWATLRDAVRAIQLQQPADSYEQLYKACENLCRNKMAPLVYERLAALCEAHVREVLGTVLGRAADNTTFLIALNTQWQQYIQQLKMIRQIFLYLDRVYVLSTPSVVSVFDMGLNLWRSHITSHAEVRRQLTRGLLALIEQERKGETIDRALVQSLVRMLSDLQIYEAAFHEPLIHATDVFYTALGAELQATLEVTDLLLQIEQRLRDEAQRCSAYLNAYSRKTLMETVEMKLLKVHAPVILEKGFDALMDEQKSDDITRLFSLFQRVHALDSLRAAFSVYIRKKGAEIIMGGSEESDRTLVDDLLAFKDRMDAVVEQSFQSNGSFSQALKESFENFVNLRQNKPAELIAKFIDSKLRAGNKEQTDAELEATLNKVLYLFRFIQGKDVFEAFYKKDLAKRLLLSKSASVDTEKLMLEKLKTECGAGFTSKLEGMFKDIDLSHDIMTLFKQSKSIQEQMGDFELNVSVLTAGMWPTYPPMDVNLPSSMIAYQEVFKTFYLSKHTGRRLLWQNSLGTCVLRAKFPQDAVKELSVSLFQAVILLLFNDRDQHTFQEIKNLTAIDDKELRRTLQSLACGKVRVLHKRPMSRDVEDGDSFVYASDFKHKLRRIKINQIQMKETVEEQQDTTERVFQDRQFQVDAAIVRIMKTRKKLSHILLINELFEQLKFPIKPQDLKKRIESLIDREYLERDAGNANVYNYLA